MLHRSVKLLTKALILTIACYMMVGFSGTFSIAQAGSDSSCAGCHLDAAKLKKNLKVEEKTKSAMQSGAG